MSIAETVRHAFPDLLFGPQVPETEIVRAERKLGEKIPPMLRELYLAFDGFENPEYGEYWLLPLTPPLEEQDGILALNHYLRHDDDDEFPREFTRTCFFFASTGLGFMWAVKALPKSLLQVGQTLDYDDPALVTPSLSAGPLTPAVIRWNPADGWFQIDGLSPLDAWVRYSTTAA